MYQRILVPVDGSSVAERGLQEAIGLAAELKARLYVLHVIGEFPLYVEMSSAMSFDESMSRLRASGEDLLATAKSAALDAGVPAVDTVLLEISRGRIAEAIVEEAQKNGCNLVVMGTHGRRGISRLTMGSDAELVVRSSSVPVLLVRQDAAKA